MEARLDLRTTAGLSEAERARALAFFAERLINGSELAVVRDTHRSQHRNRAAVIQALLELVARGVRPRARRKGHKTRIDKAGRRKAKQHRAEKKQWRRNILPPPDD